MNFPDILCTLCDTRLLIPLSAFGIDLTLPLQWPDIWRNIPFKIQSGYFPYRKINFRVGNQLTGSVIVGHFQTSSLSAIFRV